MLKFHQSVFHYCEYLHYHDRKNFKYLAMLLYLEGGTVFGSGNKYLVVKAQSEAI